MAVNEQRDTFRLLSYWNTLKEEGRLPDISAISLGAMGDLWGWCFVLDAHDRHQPEFQHFGAELVSVFGENPTGKPLSAVAHPVLSDMAPLMEEMWLMESPVSHCGEVSRADGAKLRYRSLIAPLTGGNGTITYLIGTTNFRAYQ